MNSISIHNSSSLSCCCTNIDEAFDNHKGLTTVHNDSTDVLVNAVRYVNLVGSNYLDHFQQLVVDEMRDSCAISEVLDLNQSPFFRFFVPLTFTYTIPIAMQIDPTVVTHYTSAITEIVSDLIELLFGSACRSRINGRVLVAGSVPKDTNTRRKQDTSKYQLRVIFQNFIVSSGDAIRIWELISRSLSENENLLFASCYPFQTSSTQSLLIPWLFTQSDVQFNYIKQTKKEEMFFSKVLHTSRVASPSIKTIGDSVLLPLFTIEDVQTNPITTRLIHKSDYVDLLKMSRIGLEGSNSNIAQLNITPIPWRWTDDIPDEESKESIKEQSLNRRFKQMNQAERKKTANAAKKRKRTNDQVDIFSFC